MGRFVEIRAIAEGGMGAIHHARDQLTGREVALKRMLPTAVDAARFRREASVLARLAHPGVVGYVAHGEDERGPWMAMEWAPGPDLDAHLARGRPSMEGALGIAVQIADALSAVHALGIVHRDVKPANIILASEAPLRIKLVDFGIAYDPSATTKLTSPGGAIGTPLYMAPEQIRGVGVEPRTDVHALGVVLFEMLTGRAPFEAPSPIAVLGRILLEPPPSLEGLPEGINALLGACLAKTPDARPTALEVSERLRRAPSLPTMTPLSQTLPEAPYPCLLRERRSAAVLVARELGPAELARARGVAGSVWDATREGLTFGAFHDERSPDTALVRAVHVALDLAGVRARIVVSAERLDPDAPTSDVFGRAAAIDPARPGVYCDAATAQLLARRMIMEPTETTLLRIAAAEAEVEPMVAGVITRSVGRGAEQTQLEAMIQGVVDDQRPGAAIVVGPAGQGKSRLSRDVRRAARTALGVDVLMVEHDPLSGSAPWAALGRALARVAHATDYDTMERRALACIMPSEVDMTGAALDREAFLDVMRATMRKTVRAGSRGLLVTFDDAHWADAATLRLFDELLAEDDLPLAVIAFGREELSDHHPHLFARRSPLRIALGPLGRKPSAELVRSIAPTIDAASTDAIVDLGGGSPLVLEELTRSWKESGTIASTSTSASVFEARLARLAPEQRLVVRAASVVGEAFWPKCVAAMLGEAAPNVEDVFGELEADGLVARRPSRIAGHIELRLRHALFRDAAIEATPLDVRQTLHRAAVDWVAENAKDPVLLAHHAELAGLAEIAARAYVAAAAAAATDLEASRALLLRALDLAPAATPIDERAAWLLGLEDIERSRADEVERSRVLAMLEELARDPSLGTSARFSIRVRHLAHALDRRDKGVAEQALTLVSSARAAEAYDAEGEALVVAALALRDSRDPAAALSMLGPATEGASRFSPRIRAQLDRIIGILQRRSGDVEAALMSYERAASHAGDAGSALVSVLLSQGYLQLVQGWLGDARTTLARAEREIERIHARRDRARLLGNVALLALALGRWDEARTRAEEALLLHSQGIDLDVRVDTLCVAARAALEAGDLDLASRHLDVARSALGDAAYDVVYVGWLEARLAALHHASDALARVLAALATAREARLVGFETVLCAERAALSAASGHHEQARAYAEEALALLGDPSGADFALDAFMRLREVLPPEVLGPHARRFVSVREGRAKNEPFGGHPHVRQLLA